MEALTAAFLSPSASGEETPSDGLSFVLNKTFFFLKHDPQVALELVHPPVLLQGDRIA